MSHVRKQIRDRVVSQLITSLAASAVGGNVYNGRIVPMQGENFPGVCVYTPGDHLFERGFSREETLSGTMRYLDLAREVYVSGDGLDDQADDIAVIIQKALYADNAGGRWFNGLALGFVNSDMQTQYQKAGETHYLVMQLMFKVLYHIEDGDPEHAG